MGNNFIQGSYTVKNRDKYIGSKVPYYRSSWELKICMMLDEHPSIIEWASEPVKIPYRNPITKKQTVYVPDFLVMFENKNKKRVVEMWEVKPESQAVMEKAKRPKDIFALKINMIKFDAAQKWCSKHNIVFRVIDENSIFLRK